MGFGTPILTVNTLSIKLDGIGDYSIVTGFWYSS